MANDRPCAFNTKEQEREAKANFLRKFGDDLPPDVIESMVSNQNIENWEILCDCDNEIIAGVHYENNDWYLCTFKGLAVNPEFRKQGLGHKVMQGIIDKAEKNPGCLVYAADVTTTNEASHRILNKQEFVPVSKFCWKKGEKPADVLHMVRYDPVKGECLSP